MNQATLQTALVALSFISPNGTRKHWTSMGMALKAEFGEDARDGWVDWSSRGEDYNAAGTLSAWRSFKGGKVGIGTLFAAALVEGFRFETPDVPVSPEKLAADRRERAARNTKLEAARLKAHQAASVRAASQWRMAAKTGAAPYLAAKQVSPEGCRFLPDGGIIVPLMRYDFEPPKMVGKQAILADGSKKNSSGMDKFAAAFRLGAVPSDGDDIGMGEGYSTCLSVRMAIGQAFSVYMAIDAGNLPHVASLLRVKFPKSRIILFADDDYLTGGAGVEKAREAAAAIGNALVVVPTFVTLRRATKKDESLPCLTDFNDLHVAESLAVVAEQIHSALAAPPVDLPAPILSAAPAGLSALAELDDLPDIPFTDSPAPSAECESAVGPEIVLGQLDLKWALAHCALIQGATDVWDSLNKLRMKRAAFVDLIGKDAAKIWTGHAERRSISPRNLPKIIRGVAAPAGEAGGADNIVMMLDRYTLLYGTKTVWDADKRTILGYDAMALARGNDLASRWIGHPLHREIDLDKLVFDPTQRVDLNNHINMFEGFPLTPKKDVEKVDLVLALLYSLCASEANQDDVFRWVLRWLAFPLQHPGAKMQTALLFFGEKQGTGKSLFFEGIVKPIYGAHGATGGQHQLESTYTMWRSQKLFVLFEEILSRQDKYSYFGLIKHMITGRDTPISQKFKDDRTEANHLNCVMLSNEFQAIPLEPEDRRFLVVDVRQPLDDTLLAMITAALNDGLIEAFYAFLLEYPLEGFTAHTKPIMTPSKERVINFGRPDWEAFYLSWSSGEMGVPYCSCLSKDLYVVYSRYCSKFGFRSMSLTKFSELIAQRVKKDRQWITMGAASAKNLLTVFHVPLPEGDEPETLSKQCDRFRSLADIKETA
jgi:putative DNA primase/helicase